MDPQEQVNKSESEADTPPASCDEPDANRFTRTLKSLFNKSNASKPATISSDIDAEEYNMTHKERGRAIIFNHKNFHPGAVSSESTREGTDVDRDKLEKTLKSLNFDVKVYNDATLKEINKVLSKLADEDHTERDCLLVAVFTHGNAATIQAYNGEYKYKTLWEPFAANLCPTLAGKPKIFLIQACQGDQVDKGTVVRQRTEFDSYSTLKNEYTVPNTADILAVFSTVHGYQSWRDPKRGTWFIQSVCEVFENFWEKKDLLSMMTIVSRKVALAYESRPDGNKQMPLVTSTLIREVYFTQK